MGYREFISRLKPITGDQLAPATITADKIAPGAIVAAGIGAGTITNDKLAATAVTESVTTAKTFTHASISDTAGILGSQLGTGCLHQVKKAVTWNGSATQAIVTLPANTLLMSAVSVCTVTWNGSGASVSVGYTAATGNIFDDGAVAVTAPNVAGDDARVSYGADTWIDGGTTTDLTTGDIDSITSWAHPKFKFYTAQTVVNAYVTPGAGASAGSTDIYLFYVPAA